MATSVPVPMAMPRSARGQRRGVVDAVADHGDDVARWSCSAATWSAFSAGRTSASTWSMPTWAATARAVAALSPVSIHTSRPSACELGDGLGGVGLDGVGDRDQAGQRRRRRRRTSGSARPRPRASASAASGATSTPRACHQVGVADQRRRGRRRAAVMPCPATAVEVGGRPAGPGRGRGRRRRWPRRAGARCRPRRRRPGRAASGPRPAAAATVMPATVGRPWVMVPVLSRTTAVTLRAVSSASPSPIRMPSSAALPVPTMTAVGVARPRAQGQAMMRTATAVPMASVERSVVGAEDGPAGEGGERGEQQHGGDEQAETLSARRCIGALEPCASSTRRDDLGQGACPRRPRWPRTTSVPVRLRWRR